MTTITEITPLIDKLAAEHADLLPCTAHLTELAAARSPEIAAALDRCWPVLTGALDAHIDAEDEVLFPAIARAVGDEGMTALFREEHREIRALRSALDAVRKQGGDIERLFAAVLRLADLLNAHMTREDAMLFPSARNALC